MDGRPRTCLEAALVHTEAACTGGAHALCSSGSVVAFVWQGGGADDISDGAHVNFAWYSLLEGVGYTLCNPST